MERILNQSLSEPKVVLHNGINYWGLRPSRKVESLVHQARSLGINPQPFVSEASVNAWHEGRTKLGNFGYATEVFDQLIQIIDQENIKRMYFRVKKSMPERRIPITFDEPVRSIPVAPIHEKLFSDDQNMNLPQIKIAN